MWSNGSFWDVPHVSCMVWGIRGADFPLACGEDVCLFLLLPSRGCSGLGRAELGDSHDTAGTLPSLAQPVCLPDWILLCPGDPFSSPSLPVHPQPPPGISQHWVQAQLPHGDGAGSRRDRASSKFGRGVPHSRSLAKGPHTCSLEQNQSIQVGPVFLCLPKPLSLSTCVCLS